jgi:hypothetical protein
MQDVLCTIKYYYKNKIRITVLKLNVLIYFVIPFSWYLTFTFFKQGIGIY